MTTDEIKESVKLICEISKTIKLRRKQTDFSTRKCTNNDDNIFCENFVPLFFISGLN